jgi:hypothetical protein
MMYLLQSSSQVKRQAVVKKITAAELGQINSEKFVFDWSALEQECEVYQLSLIDDDEILGVMALKDYPEQQWLEIKLLESSIENVGRHKKYKRIAGCFISFACKEAIKRYAPVPCVSLIPKTQLKDHYIQEYGMLDGSKFLYLDEQPLLNMLKTYYYGN